QLSYVMPLNLEEIFGIAAGSKYIGAMWSINGIVVFAATPLMVLLFKKTDALLSVSIAGIGYVIGFGLYAFTKNIAVIFLLVLVWSCGEVLCAANTGTFIANHAPLTHRARFQSIYEIIQGTGRAIGPLLMSCYLLKHSYIQVWLLVSLISLFAVIAYFILYQYSRLTKL
ncbi:MAG: MFS transporter, partial [Clostridiales bacterium]|nr:MFS transporter [Clostridiales bacterium]